MVCCVEDVLDRCRTLDIMVEQVKLLLEGTGVTYRLIPLTGKAIKVEDVVKNSKVSIDVKSICKTIILKSPQGYLGILLKGGDRIDSAKINSQLGKSRIVRLDEVKNITGVELGSVCPLLLQIPLFVDKNVAQLDFINFGTGDPFFGIEIKFSDLRKLISFQLLDLSVLKNRIKQ